MQPTLVCGKTQRLDWLDRIEGLLCRSLTVLFQPHSTAWHWFSVMGTFSPFEIITYAI
jgi:hypothetical protein